MNPCSKTTKQNNKKDPGNPLGDEPAPNAGTHQTCKTDLHERCFVYREGKFSTRKNQENTGSKKTVYNREVLGGEKRFPSVTIASYNAYSFFFVLFARGHHACVRACVHLFVCLLRIRVYIPRTSDERISAPICSRRAS